MLSFNLYDWAGKAEKEEEEEDVKEEGDGRTAPTTDNQALNYMWETIWK